MFLLTTAPFTHNLWDSAIWRDVAISRVWGSRFCFSFSLGFLCISVSLPRLLSGQQDVLALWFYVITGWAFVMLSSSHLNRDRGLQGDWNITLSKIPVKIFTTGTLWLTCSELSMRLLCPSGFPVLPALPSDHPKTWIHHEQRDGGSSPTAFTTHPKRDDTMGEHHHNQNTKASFLRLFLHLLLKSL